MDFENEEIFDEKKVSEYSEKEELKKLIAEATEKLQSLEEDSDDIDADNGVTNNSVDYSDNQLIDTMIIKDATEKLASYEGKEIISSSEEYSDLAELASTIKEAANRLKSSSNKNGGSSYSTYNTRCYRKISKL